MCIKTEMSSSIIHFLPYSQQFGKNLQAPTSLCPSATHDFSCSYQLMSTNTFPPTILKKKKNYKNQIKKHTFLMKKKPIICVLPVKDNRARKYAHHRFRIKPIVNQLLVVLLVSPIWFGQFDILFRRIFQLVFFFFNLVLRFLLSSPSKRIAQAI